MANHETPGINKILIHGMELMNRVCWSSIHVRTDKRTNEWRKDGPSDIEQQNSRQDNTATTRANELILENLPIQITNQLITEFDAP